jgi:Reverse transcriptase (RNA-dependent DNA polymerase).
VKQGDGLSLLLFIIYMDQVLKQQKKKKNKNCKMRPVFIHTLIYVDEIVLILENEQDLQQSTIEWAKQEG